MTSSGPKPGRDHILIVGPGKTGTTGVYTSIRAGLVQAAPNAHCLFEPPNARTLDQLLMLAPGDPILVKVTMDSWAKAVPNPLAFERRVMTVRDPRDVLVSTLLFRPLTVRSIGRATDKGVDTFVAALEAKEGDPSAYSVRELFELEAKLGIGGLPYDGLLRNMGRQRDFLAKYPGFLMQYENFVGGDLQALSDYLGFPVQNTVASDSAMFGHIARSQSSGEFLSWFTPGDLEYFNEMYAEMLEAFGYSATVDLPAKQTIEPAHGSDYVRSRYLARKATLEQVRNDRAEDWSPADVDSLEALRRTADFAANGDPAACLRVANVILAGHLGPEAGDDQEALRWARAGAQLGSVPSMKLTIDLLERLAQGDAGLHREQRRWRAEVAIRRTKPAPAEPAAAADKADLKTSPRAESPTTWRRFRNRLRAAVR